MQRNNRTVLDLLPDCTVRLVVNGIAATGTGFFVAPGYLLTCAHVVQTADGSLPQITATWQGQDYTASLVRATSGDYPDLALLQISYPPAHPCVYLFDGAVAGDDLYTYGYSDRYAKGESATFTCEGPSNGSDMLIKFKLGEVRPGLSGSPLLNLRTGAVCGVVKLTRGADTSMGGRATPIERALREFAQLQEKQRQFHKQDARWADSITAKQKQINGLEKIRGVAGAVEIFFSYHENKKDQDILAKLESHLAVLRRNHIITDWHKGKLTPGQEPEAETLKHLNSARIICLLVSAEYLNDPDLYEKHVGRAMERRKQDGTIVIPILVRNVDGWEDTEFGGLLTIPRNKQPISKWDDVDEVLAEVVNEIRKTVKGLSPS
jgi:hypothetical protein